MRISLILGRAGHSGQSIPDKNVTLVLGRPLVEYPIRAAQAARCIDRVFVSTNCPKIKKVALTCGAAVIERPDELAGPDACFTEAIEHALGTIAASVEIVAVMPTN